MPGFAGDQFRDSLAVTLRECAVCHQLGLCAHSERHANVTVVSPMFLQTDTLDPLTSLL